MTLESNLKTIEQATAEFEAHAKANNITFIRAYLTPKQEEKRERLDPSIKSQLVVLKKISNYEDVPESYHSCLLWLEEQGVVIRNRSKCFPSGFKTQNQAIIRK